jgi:hypothetical protein
MYPGYWASGAALPLERIAPAADLVVFVRSER